MLARFGELVGEHAVARVADVGCGPGRAAVFVRESCPGLEVVGVDLSLGLLREGRRAHPTVAFAQGVLSSIPLRTGSVGGVVSWYSIIHTGGHVLVAFQAGNGEAELAHETSPQAFILARSPAPSVVSGTRR